MNFLKISIFTPIAALSLVQTTTFRPHISLLSPSYRCCFCVLIYHHVGHLPKLFLHFVKITTTYFGRHFRITAIVDFLACCCRHPNIILGLGKIADLSFFTLLI